MAEKDDSMIGYDPLAWLQESEPAEAEVDAPFPVDIALKQESGQAEVLATDEEESTQRRMTLVEEESFAADIEPGAEASAEFDVMPQANDVRQVVLEAVQNIQNVAQLHERVLNALDHANKIDIDASAIKTVDTATLQLLLVLKQTAIKMDKQVTIDFPSEKFIEAATLLGLAQMLDVEQAVAGFF